MARAAAMGPIVLAAGGTGGHMFPAEALARELTARGRRVALMTDRRGQSFGDRVPGVETMRIRAGRFDGGLIGKMRGTVELLLGVVEARATLRKLAPAAVIGFGGYPSVPTVAAAARLGLPTVIHEQNALLGRANRLLAGRARRLALSFAETGRLKPAERRRAVVTGNPVRPAIAGFRAQAYTVPVQSGGIEILILGGSQGARVFSMVVPDALSLLPPALRGRVRLNQQTRPEDLESVRTRYAQDGITAELASFFDDVPQRLARAQLVIARAGASTVAELGVIGRPAILVPYPHAADDHQTANAAAFAAAGAGWAMGQPQFTAERLAGLLTELLDAPERLARAAAAAHALGRPDAESRLADLVLALIEGSGNSRGIEGKAA